MNIQSENTYRWIQKAPIKLSIVYLTFTLLIYFFGPIKWSIDNSLILFLLLVIYFLALYIGYYTNLKLFPISEYKREKANSLLHNSLNYSTNTRLLFLISGTFTIIKYIIYAYTYHGGIDFSQLFNLGSNYFDRVHSSQPGNFLTLIIIYTNVLSLFWLPIGLFYWSKLYRRDQLFFVLVLLLSVIYWLNQGTLKGLGDMVLYVIPIFLIILWRKKFLTGRKKKKNRKKIYIVGIVFLLFLTTFGLMQENRADYQDNTSTILNDHNYRFIEEEKDIIFPYTTKYLTFYLSHGYTGMSLALKTDYDWTFGLGASRSLLQTSEEILDIDVLNKTYPQKIENEYGWPNGMYWPTAFTWFASDLTFLGVTVLMFAIGYVFSYVWNLFIFERSILGLVIASQLFIMIVYLPANNQLFQASENFYANLSLIFLLIFRRATINQFFTKK